MAAGFNRRRFPADQHIHLTQLPDDLLRRND
jgi:hypothetical protein